MRKANEVKKEKRRGSFVIKLAMFGVTLVLLLAIVERQVQIGEKRDRLAQLQSQLDSQNQKNQELRKSLEDEDGLQGYAERRARQELDYAKPGERIYIDMGGE
ncbi:FtsB family cell division protein [Acutalibacter caecimuris]|uniref:FtsB family cell division protein n=1 Tax=Acutalibacter caecimuris TaxID=3093657 RepID=UPI002AC99F02|nr:septum formation initiator family protein [Acutalibacter sp. M00118]